MLKELFATCLLLHGCASSNINSVHADSYNCDDSNIVEAVRSEPYLAANNNQIHGLYNFRQVISYSNVPVNTSISFNFTLDGSTSPDLAYYCPFYYNTNLYYLNFIGFNFSNVSTPNCQIRFAYYDYSGTSSLLQTTIYEGNIDDILSSAYLNIFFNILPEYSLDSTKLSIFKSLFTYEDNDYVVSYNGYYSFYQTTPFSLSQNVDVGGTINNGFDGIILSMSIYPSGNQYYWAREYYDTLTQKYNVYGSAFVPYSNLLINGKMSRASYNALSLAGIFSYVHDSTYDDSDFHDLLFTIMDTPVYFITSLFNFELFGMNLFIAFSGLLTLAVVIMIIRKIW